MHARKNDHLLIHKTVIRTVRKAVDQETTRTAMDHCVGIREGNDRCERRIN